MNHSDELIWNCFFSKRCSKLIDLVLYHDWTLTKGLPAVNIKSLANIVTLKSSYIMYSTVCSWLSARVKDPPLIPHWWCFYSHSQLTFSKSTLTPFEGNPQGDFHSYSMAFTQSHMVIFTKKQQVSNWIPLKMEVESFASNAYNRFDLEIYISMNLSVKKNPHHRIIPWIDGRRALQLWILQLWKAVCP